MKLAYGVYMLTNSHRFVRQLRRFYQPSVHGHKAWGSSYLIMDYLQHRPMRRNARVLELGCGWAPAGIYCAKHFDARVRGVDRDPDVFPYTELLATLNDVKVETEERSFEDLKAKDFAKTEVVIGSDICFWDALVKPLSRLIRTGLDSGVKRVIIADPGRPPFRELARKLSKHHAVTVDEWYALEPKRYEGEIMEIRP